MASGARPSGLIPRALEGPEKQSHKRTIMNEQRPQGRTVKPQKNFQPPAERDTCPHCGKQVFSFAHLCPNRPPLITKNYGL